MKSTMFYPFRELGSLQRDVDQFLSSVFNGASERVPSQANLNLGEDENNYFVEAIVPGIDPATLEVHVEDQVLRFSGARAARPEGEQIRWHLNERPAGQFKHQLRLPANVDASRIVADYKGGVLFITIPKSEAAKPRQIEVRVS